MTEAIPRPRRIYTNRTLNLRATAAIGFDMDYTLIHYDVDAWERHAFGYAVKGLAEAGWPTEDLAFEPDRVIRGLVVDTELGNIVKANRFGFVKQAMHGTQVLPYEQTRDLYARQMIDTEEPRWQFMNTLFSISEGNLYAQLVQRLDEGVALPGVSGYADLYREVRGALDFAHLEGKLKGDIGADPDRFVDLDPEAALALQDLRHAGKKLLLITNSDWTYTRAMMSYAFDRFLPEGTSWRDLFDVVIVDARKPAFFTQRNPLYEVATDDGLLRPVVRSLEEGKVFSGGDAGLVEAWLGASGEEVLYVGDHIFSDVHVSKSVQRWRTALVLRELEAEIGAIEAFVPTQQELAERMQEKEALEQESVRVRVELQRLQHRYGPPVETPRARLEARLGELRARIGGLDDGLGPLARAASTLASPRWGLLFRTGGDKSHLARQVEAYADVYTSRVSNFLHHGPFAYLRSARGSLPPDPL